jgi:kynureninase
MEFSTDPGFARQADLRDELRSFRKKFRIPLKDGKEQIYFLGNSLGLQPVDTGTAIQEILEQWAEYGVEGFFQGSRPWINYHDSLREPLAAIVGAHASEIVVMNQLSVNLHLMMASFYRPQGKRNRIVCESKAFPSDQYVLETHLRFLGLDPEEIIIEISPEEGTHQISTEKIRETIRNHQGRVALVLWSGVNYYTGQLFDIKQITRIAHENGAIAGFDLAHAVGNVELKLHEWNVDFACWCSYKYLNSGPGAIAGAYLHDRYHTDEAVPRLAGWWGYDKATRFKMEKGFIPIHSAEGWQLSTPSMVLFAMHKASLDIFTEAGMDRLVEKGRRLSDYLIAMLNELNDSFVSKPFEILTPQSRGCQVSIFFRQNGKKLFDELMNEGIFADWREPGVIRIAPVPLYNTFEEVWQFVQTIKKLIE